ncbi:TonB-dependent siderophore receptor [Aquisalimonas asiatica]|uniref:Iron complex outermembrane recepter protein n=1 Tax=Aquisalimonas asiatica TaxID=406100 RepID=A0A1H8SX34_9GAMM|nr:TonB-dependent siderophore receptor [Aquisalimonas asiatica]SEO83549.1 iron complex outermembrane recepter protein [Aquisalimonas asiatica]
MQANQSSGERQPILRLSAIVLALLAVSLQPALPASAQTQDAATESTRQYAIAAGPLGEVLNTFADQAGLLLSADANLTDGKHSDGLQGSYTPREGMNRLLTGSGLRARFVDGDTVTLEAAPTSGAVQLEPLGVVAATENPWGPADGFVARRSATATKTDTPLAETPQSVSVMTREQIEAQGADSLDKAIRYTAGAFSPGGGNSGTAGTLLHMRGFHSGGASGGGGSLYLDGRRFPINSITGAQEPFLYERIEVLKGPASVLYGQARPGGIINLVSKRPTSEPLREIGLQVGSWNRQRATVDVGGPVTEDGSVGYRITGLMQDSDTMISEIPDDRKAVSAAVDWHATDRTTLTFLASLHDSETAYNYGKPYDGSVQPNPNGRIDRDLFVGEPGFDGLDATRYTLGYRLEHAFNDTWTARHNLLWYDTETDWAFHSISNRTDDTTRRLVDRSVQHRIDEENGVTVDNHVQARWQHGRFQHTSLLGVDFRNSEFRQRVWAGTNQPLDVFNPEYGHQPTLSDDVARATSIDYSHLGIYAQNQVTFDDRWVFLLGGRWDDAELKDRQTAADGSRDRQTAGISDFTWRTGLIYLFDNGLAPYASYSESFEPVTGADASGNRFDPTTGQQYEVGIKYEPDGYNASLTVAAYELTQQDVQTADLDNPGFSVQTGEVRSRGFEVEGRAHIGNSLDLIAAYAYTDNEVTESNDDDLGNTTAAVPKHTASLWADYYVLGGPAQGLSVGGGIRHVGRTFNNDNTARVPSYTVYDAALRYRIDRLRLSVHVNNLFDKNYVEACTFACFHGDERNFTLGMNYDW